MYRASNIQDPSIDSEMNDDLKEFKDDYFDYKNDDFTSFNQYFISCMESKFDSYYIIHTRIYLYKLFLSQ